MEGNEREQEKVGGPMEYVIGEKTYIQKPLYLGQIKMLTKTLKGIEWPKTLDVPVIIDVIMDVIPEAFAVVLIEKGKDSVEELKRRDIESIRTDFENVLDSVTIMKVINDFLAFNPVTSMMGMLNNLIRTTYTIMPMKPELIEKTPETGLTDTLSTSAEETSQEEIKSSGGTP
jgi:hypothetical protein